MLAYASAQAALGEQTGLLSKPEQARLAWLSGLSLALCAVGVANASLMSVSERIREIGTLKCLGAPDRLVAKLLLAEAAIFGGLGSAFGAAVGFAVALLAVGSLPHGHTWWQIAAGLGRTLAVGIGVALVASLAPTLQAARLPAAEALRREV